MALPKASIEHVPEWFARSMRELHDNFPHNVASPAISKIQDWWERVMMVSESSIKVAFNAVMRDSSLKEFPTFAGFEARLPAGDRPEGVHREFTGCAWSTTAILGDIGKYDAAEREAIAEYLMRNTHASWLDAFELGNGLPLANWLRTEMETALQFDPGCLGKRRIAIAAFEARKAERAEEVAA